MPSSHLILCHTLLLPLLHSNYEETMETVRGLIFLGSKITVDGGCSHKIKKCLLLESKAMTNLDSILKSRDITLPTKVCVVKANRRKQWHPTPVLLPGKSHGQRSLLSCSLWGHKELDMPERLHFHFHALEKEMATHSSVLAWRMPGTGEPSGLPSMGSHRVGHD